MGKQGGRTSSGVELRINYMKDKLLVVAYNAVGERVYHTTICSRLS